MAKPVKHYGAWRIRWLDSDRRRCSEVHPSYAEAEKALRRHQSEADEIRAGLRKKAPPRKTFSELCDYWLAHRAPQKRSFKDDESIIRARLRPAFGSLELGKLGVADVDGFVRAHAHLDKKTINNYLTLLISMLNCAVDLEWLMRMPRIRKPRVRLFSRDYRYLRSTNEITRFLTAARAESDVAFYLYATAVYTGMRAGELAGLEWGDIDFDRRLITVQRSFDGPTKAEDVRYVPILDALLPLLREWRLKSPLRTVFPSAVGKMFGSSARIFQETLREVLSAGGFSKSVRRGKERGYITFHDLRHTFASHWVMNNGDLFRLQKILGHKSVQMTMRYAHLAPDAFVQDYGRLASLPHASAVVSLRTP